LITIEFNLVNFANGAMTIATTSWELFDGILNSVLLILIGLEMITLSLHM